jgi:hypothetical protein
MLFGLSNTRYTALDAVSDKGTIWIRIMCPSAVPFYKTPAKRIGLVQRGHHHIM